MNTLSSDDLDKVENYMGQVFAEDSDDNSEGIFAQLETEEENDLAVVASYLAQLNGEELNEIAAHSGELNAEAFAQTMSDDGMGEMWDNMQNFAPNFAQAFARELMEDDEDFL